MQRILVVDDEFGLIEALADVLSAEGYRVTTAINGKLALAAIAEQAPDLILLDLMMPIMSGAELLDALDALEPPLVIPVIMMSAAPEAVTPELRTRTAALLKKPFTYRQLTSVLRAVFDGQSAVEPR